MYFYDTFFIYPFTCQLHNPHTIKLGNVNFLSKFRKIHKNIKGNMKYDGPCHECNDRLKQSLIILDQQDKKDTNVLTMGKCFDKLFTTTLG